MSDFYIMDKNRQQVRQLLMFKGDIKSLSVDLSSWADDNGNVTTAVWTVENGQAVIGTKAINSNVVSCIVTTANPGWSMIKLVASNSTYSEAIYIKCKAKDPQAFMLDDYRECHYA